METAKGTVGCNALNAVCWLIGTALALNAGCNKINESKNGNEVNTMSTHNADEYLAREAIVAEIDMAYHQSMSAGDTTLDARYNSGDSDLKQHILGYAWKHALAEHEAERTPRFVEFLAKKVASETDFLQAQAARFALETPVRTFSLLARDTIAKTAITGQNAAALTRLVGYLRITERTSELDGLASGPQTLGSPLRDGAGIPWAARLSLARMGHDAMLDLVVLQVKQEKDTILRATKLFPDLAFTRRDRAMDELRRQLESTERLPSLRPGNVGRPVAGYAAEALVAAVQGAPEITDSVTPEDIVKVRAWAAAMATWQMRP